MQQLGSIRVIYDLLFTVILLDKFNDALYLAALPYFSFKKKRKGKMILFLSKVGFLQSICDQSADGQSIGQNSSSVNG